MSYKLLVVIHGTEKLINEALEEIQSAIAGVSYHVLISMEGTIYYAVPPSEKAYAAARSSFNGEHIDNSVDDFAYHIALETIEDVPITNKQYLSLAFVISRTGVDSNRIVLHKDIDTTGLFKDPIDFSMTSLNLALAKFPMKRLIDVGFDYE